MITRSFNPKDLREATEGHRDLLPETFDFEGWVDNDKNILVKDEDSIGFITYEYPGVYSAHHFHKTKRGRAAINSSLSMLKYGFDHHPIKLIRGMTKTKLRAACWIARQLGMTSYGLFDTHEDEYELFCLTRDEFYNYNKRIK